MNYMQYRMIRDQEDRRQQNREAQARWRERRAASSSESASNVSQNKPKEKKKQDETQRQSEKRSKDVPVRDKREIQDHAAHVPLGEEQRARATQDEKVAQKPGEIDS